MTTPSRINVIIPTLGTAERAQNLLDSLNQLTGKSEFDVVPIVVVNGQVFDQELYSRLESRTDIILVKTELRGLPNAYLVGRKAVDGEFFSFLDDDDRYTDDALSKRIRPLMENAEIDAVVSNGYRISPDTRALIDFYPSFPSNGSDPLAALVHNNWLTSCGALFRAERISTSYFTDLTAYYEWTCLASRLASHARLYFLADKTFIVNDTPGSLSKSLDYMTSEPVFLEQLIRNTPFQLKEKAKLKDRLASSYNRLANYYAGMHDFRKAMHYHGKCIVSSRYGLKYSFWPRHLLKHWLSSRTPVDSR